MTDIVERLRYCGKQLEDRYSGAAILDEAADEIERLQGLLADLARLMDQARMAGDEAAAEIERLRAEVKQWKDGYDALRIKEAGPWNERRIRSDALEEAAKVAGEYAEDHPAAWRIAAAIRALKEKP